MRPIESRPGPRLRLMAARGVAVLVALGALSGCAGGDDGRVVSTGSERGADTAHPDHQGIVPNESIAGVRLRMGRAAVTRLLGAPEAVRRSDLHFGWTTLVYRSRGLRVTLDEGGAVWNLQTESQKQRGPGGVGVGSSEQALRETVPALACRAYGGPARYRRWRSCVDVSGQAGPYTKYTLANGRVFRVTVAAGLAI